MVSNLFKLLAAPTVLKRSLKWLFVMSGCFVVFSLTGCQEHLVNGMLNPKGIIAVKERKLFFDTLALMLIVVIPVIIMSFTFLYHYQISHKTRDYKPNWNHSYFLETIWWTIPCVIIFILAVMTWKATHELDPYNRISGHDEKPLIVEVIALPWKWLFIYPEQQIATVNYLEIPVGQPVEFVLTTDNVPMSAFMVPQLGSQIYTMAGMRTRLHLIASEVGVYEGLNTQFNGDGFSDMHFKTHVVEAADMEKWINDVKHNPDTLSTDTYELLLKPTVGEQPKFFGKVTDNIFDDVIHTYMSSVGPTHPRQAVQPQLLESEKE